jgi:hypothetical protein
MRRPAYRRCRRGGWGSYVRQEIEAAMDKHGIDVGAEGVRGKPAAVDPPDVVKPLAAG